MPSLEENRGKINNGIAKLIKLTLVINYEESSFVPNSEKDALEYARTQPQESIFWGTNYDTFYAVIKQYVIYGNYCGLRTDSFLEKTMQNENMCQVLRNIMDIICTPLLSQDIY